MKNNLRPIQLELHTHPTSEVSLQHARHLAAIISAALWENQPTFLLMSGGSILESYKQMLNLLPPELSLSNLTAGLIDERWGHKGHTDSNQHQLESLRVWSELKARGTKMMEMLVSDQPQAAVKQLNQSYALIAAQSQRVILSLGMGEDGHTAGWLPTRELETFTQLYDKPEFVTYFEVDPLDSNNPFRHRITTTLKSIELATEIVLFAVGANKKAAITAFQANDQPVNQLPVLALYRAQVKPVLFTDQD